MSVRWQLEGGVGEIVLDAPPLNLVNTIMFEQLGEILALIESQPVRAVLVRGAGEHFSAGADIKGFAGLTAAQAAAATRNLLPVLQKLAALPVPTIAAISGACLGAGFELALCCDLVLAGSGARLGLVETLIGGFPFAGGAQRLAARAGQGRAKQAVYTGERFSASTMYEWGVVNQVIPDDGDLLDQARLLARRFAYGPGLAYRATKQLIDRSVSATVGEADDLMPDLVGQVIGSQDFRDGTSAFLGRRTGGPFSGR